MEIETIPKGKTLGAYVEQSWDELQSACTRCGKCVEVCPVVPHISGLAEEDPSSVVGGVLDFMRNLSAPMKGPSYDWAKQCNGCDECLPVCPEKINPRRMLALANSEVSRRTTPTPHLFHKMSRAIRILVAMQIVPADAARLLRPKRPRPVDIVFYTGCNAIRTPQLLFNAMSILDSLGVNYEVMGGPAACCGIVHSKWEGDLQKGGKVSEQTLHRFGEFSPTRVLSWCPSCQIHLTETIKGYREVKFDIDHITKYLMERKDELISLFTTPVDLRVLVHTHDGAAQSGQDMLGLVQAIPGINVVGEARESGYVCGLTGADKCPSLKEQERKKTIDRCREGGIDAVVSLYHSCHRNLASEGVAHGFKVISFTELLVRALGQEPYADTLDQFRGRSDWGKMVDEASPLLEANGIDFDREELAAALPEIFSMAEYRGGLCQFEPGA